ncbi:MAG: dTDP-4-dehydrorhamnose reductase [Saprospiraceae bacterium]
MKVVVIGSGGQLGRELQSIQNLLSGVEWIFTNRQEIDLGEAKKMDALDRLKPDVVVNCAAYTRVDQAEKEIETCWESNVLGPARLAKKCAQNDCWLIHISSDYIYHHNPGRPFKEEDPLYPRGIYAASKAGGEVMIRQFHKKHIILRTSWLYGNEGPNFVKTMIRLAGQQDKIKVVDDQWGAPTFVHDLALGIKKIIRTLKENSDGNFAGTYHYANEGVVSWCGFAKEIMQLSSPKTEVEAIGSAAYVLPAPRPGWSVMSLGKLKKVFDIYPPHWRISLKKYLQELSEDTN